MDGRDAAGEAPSFPRRLRELADAGLLDEAARLVDEVHDQVSGRDGAGVVVAALQGLSEVCAIAVVRRSRAWPRPADMLCELGTARSQKGDRMAAIAFFEAACEMDPHSYRAHALLGLEQFATKRFDAAEAMFGHALAINPKGYGATVGTALLCRRRGEVAEAIECLFRALEIEPKGAWAASELVATLVGEGRWNEARWMSHALWERGALSDERFSVLTEYAGYLQSNWDNLRAAVDGLRDRFVRDSHAIEHLRAQIVSGRPGSLVRLGDGEGCFAYGLRDPKGAALNRLTFEYMSRAWFGQAIPALTLVRISELFREAIASATLVGLPRPSRFQYELRNDVRGAVGVAEVVGVLAGWCDVEAIVVDANLNLAFARRDVSDRLLAGLPSVSTISPHPKLGAALRARYGIGDGRDLLVPGQADSTALPVALRTGSHLERFEENIGWIKDRIVAGDVVLVAAGLLGKCYCGEIQKAGAFAIDIGATADVWMGLASRGVHHSLEEKALMRLEVA